MWFPWSCCSHARLPFKVLDTLTINGTLILMFERDRTSAPQFRFTPWSRPQMLSCDGPRAAFRPRSSCRTHQAFTGSAVSLSQRL